MLFCKEVFLRCLVLGLSLFVVVALRFVLWLRVGLFEVGCSICSNHSLRFIITLSLFVFFCIVCVALFYVCVLICLGFGCLRSVRVL